MTRLCDDQPAPSATCGRAAAAATRQLLRMHASFSLGDATSLTAARSRARRSASATLRRRAARTGAQLGGRCGGTQASARRARRGATRTRVPQLACAKLLSDALPPVAPRGEFDDDDDDVVDDDNDDNDNDNHNNNKDDKR